MDDAQANLVVKLHRMTEEENAVLHRLAENQKAMIAALRDEANLNKWLFICSLAINVILTACVYRMQA